MTDLVTKVANNNWTSGSGADVQERDRSQQGLDLFNVSTHQVTIKAVNMGTFNRRMYLAGKYEVSTAIRDQLQPLLRFFLSSAAHVFLACEADSLNSEVSRAHLEKYGLKGLVFDQEMLSRLIGKHCKIRFQAVSCHFRMATTSDINVLDWLVAPYSETYDENWGFVGCIFRIDFGEDGSCRKTPKTAVFRGGVPNMTIAVFHIQNDIAKKPERSRKLFLEFLVKCVRHKVDFIFGDGNMAANSCGTNQAYADRANSTLAKALRQTQLVFNSQREVWDRLSVQVIETESAKTLAAYKSPMRSDLDSMVAWTLGWAASPLAAYRRDQLSRLVQEIRLSESTDDLTEEEVALLDATEVSKPLMQFNDWNVKVSEHAKHITNEDLFFESGAGGWHKPLYTTLRCGEVPNNRKRKANPYRTYKQELSIAAFLSLITVSDASALTDVGTCSTKADLEEDGISLMFILLLASVMVHLYFILRWTFSYLSDRLCARRFGDEVIDHATCMCCERPTGRSVKNRRQCSVSWCRHRCCDECSGNRARPFVCPCHDYQGAPAYYPRDASASCILCFFKLFLFAYFDLLFEFVICFSLVLLFI